MIPYLLAFLLGAAFGMVPFSFLLGLSRGKDIRKIGSGNIGATNLHRALGPVYFIIGFILDGVKGLIPVLLARAWGWPAALAAAGAILGHIFNPFFKFRGGKGVSTIIGAALGLTVKSFLIGFGSWLAVYLISFYVALASIVLAIVLPVAAFALSEGTLLDRILITLLGILIVFAHRTNIRRIFRGEEPKTVLWKKK